MSDRPRKLECEAFLEALEATSPGSGVEATPGERLGPLRETTRGHAEVCADCKAAVEEMSVTRTELARLSEAAVEPGPWFAARVMGAIRTKEREIEEKKNGVWVSVRRLAPRLVAFCTVLLVLGGTWAVEVRKAEEARQAEMRPVEGLFDTTASTPLNDDVLAISHQEPRP
jgi:hypothetical protein